MIYIKIFIYVKIWLAINWMKITKSFTWEMGGVEITISISITRTAGCLRRSFLGVPPGGYLENPMQLRPCSTQCRQAVFPPTHLMGGFGWVRFLQNLHPVTRRLTLIFSSKESQGLLVLLFFFLRDMHEMFQHLFTNKQVDHHPMGWWWFKSRWLKTSAENH